MRLGKKYGRRAVYEEIRLQYHCGKCQRSHLIDVGIRQGARLEKVTIVLLCKLKMKVKLKFPQTESETMELSENGVHTYNSNMVLTLRQLACRKVYN